MPQETEGGDILDILGGTSAQADPTAGGMEGATAGQGQDGKGAFSFAGRSYADQPAAEKAHNALYGKYSGQQETFNKLKKALEDKETLQALAQNPEWRDIIGKVGIKLDAEEVEEETAGEPGADFDWSSLPPPMQQAYHEFGVERTMLGLEREERLFERKLKRELTDDEHNAVMDVVARVGDLTFEEAYKLAFHDRMLKEAVEAQRRQAKPQGLNRLSPPPALRAGTAMSTKKGVADMSKGEFREHLRNSDEFKQLLSG